MPKSPSEMKHRLRVGKVMTIGFVPAGDNPEAELVFFKSIHDGAETFAEIGLHERLHNEIWDMTHRIMRAISSAVFEAEDDQDPAAIIDDSLDQFATAVRAATPQWLAGEPVQKHQGRNMPKFDKKKLDEVARTEFERIGKEAADAVTATQLAQTAQATAEAAQAAAAEAQQAAEAALAAAAEEGGDDDVTKGMSPEVKAAFAKQAEEAEGFKKDLAAERETRERDGMSIRFAKGGDFEKMSGDERTDVLLKAKQALSPEDWARLETMLKAASKQISEGDLLKEAGSDIGDSNVGEAEAAFEAAVAKAMEADPKLSLPQARAHITKTEGALYRAFNKERQEANGS